MKLSEQVAELENQVDQLWEVLQTVFDPAMSAEDIYGVGFSVEQLELVLGSLQCRELATLRKVLGFQDE